MPQLTDKTAIAHLVLLCYARGLRKVILSPGSRNAPLSISFLGHGGFDVQVVGDERVAAHIALGMAQVERKPCILVCTSGTAMLDYAPAVAEASYQRLPLLVLTADRPEEWVDQMEGQTMRQQGALSNFVRKQFQFPQEAQEGDRLWYAERIVNEAITACTYPEPGPVHINIPLKEPLYGQRDYQSGESLKIIEPMVVPILKASAAQLQELSDELASYHRVMMIMGLELPGAVDVAVIESWRKRGVVILNETSSNALGEDILTCIDRSIAAIPHGGEEAYLPELIITMGGPIISKRIKMLLREHRPEGHWHIDSSHAEIDLFQSQTRAIYFEPMRLLAELVNDLGVMDQAYSERWRSLGRHIEQEHRNYIDAAPFSDLRVYDQVLSALPSPAKVQMANSAAVRYVQIFPMTEGVKYYGNRGVSGIEGCSSTAVGMAMTTHEPVVLLTGDMAFRYDSNAFWLKEIPNGLKCIVVNNEGGGIFRIIKGPDSTEHLATAFEAHQENGARGIAELYHIPYLSAADEASLSEALTALFADDRTTILEVFTPREINADVLRGYFKALELPVT